MKNKISLSVISYRASSLLLCLVFMLVFALVVLPFGTVSVKAANPLDSVPVLAFYPFNSNTSDFSGHNHHGTANGGVALIADGYQNGAYSFDGINDYIRVNVDINPSGHPKLTMGAWVKPADGNPIRQIMSHDNGGYDRSLGIDNRGGVIGWSAFAGPSGAVLGGESIVLNQWTFVAVVYDQTVSKVTLYVNGNFYSKTGAPGPGWAYTDIGHNPSFGEYFKGQIDNVFIIGDALSETQIAYIRNNGECVFFDCNEPPVANAGGPYFGSEGISIALDGSASSDPNNNPLTYNWTVSAPDVCTFDNPNIANPNLSCIDNGHFPTEITVNDGSISDSDDTVVQVNNLPPTADLGNGGPISEGDSVSVNFSNVYDSSSVDTEAGFHYAFDCNSGNLDEVTYINSDTRNSTSCVFVDNGSFEVTGKIMDKDDGYNRYSSTVTVNNIAPTLGMISVDTTLVPINTTIHVNAPFTDPGILDTHTAVWDWGDGSSAGTVTQEAGSGSVNDSHSYSVPGVYTLKLTLTDNDNAVSNTSVYQYVVVYDPNGGFVTGGGWINSPAGAYTADPSLTGKASFGFVAKYQKGATIPVGNTEFQFKAGDLNFKSSRYEWLVVAGTKAQFKGEGTINGQGIYKFMTFADDNNPDTFRIKIWWEDDSGEHVVYDNGILQPLGGGSIVVHNK